MSTTTEVLPGWTHDFPCSEGLDWLREAGITTTAEAWDKCQNSQWMLWALRQISYHDDRVLRLFACWCVRHTPLVDGRVVWDLLTDERSRAVVEVAERYARGNATEYELREVREAAWSAAREAGESGAAAAEEAGAAACAAWGAWAAARGASKAAWAVLWAAGEAAGEAQADQLRRMVPNPFAAIDESEATK